MKQRKFVDEYYACCFKADLRPAIKLFGKNKKLDKLALKFTKRFRSGPNDGLVKAKVPLVVKDVIQAYRAYYRTALMRLSSLNEAESILKRRLIAILSAHKNTLRSSASFNEVERQIARALRAHGFYARPGHVAPFRNILIWKRERDRTYAVKLPLGQRRVRVKFLEDFVELGWMNYASFGRASSASGARNAATLLFNEDTKRLQRRN